MRSIDLLSHFDLRAVPFSKEIEDQDLWLPEAKTQLVDDIEEALAQRQSILLLGEPGVGKTCVLRVLRHRLPQNGFRLTYCRNATLGRRDFYRHLCHNLGLTPTATASNLFLAVETHVQELHRDKLHPVFLLDEAHLLHPDMLAHLHILMNYQWDAKALLSLVLVGLPELESSLVAAGPSLPAHPHPPPLPHPPGDRRRHRRVRALPPRCGRNRTRTLPRRRARRTARVVAGGTARD